MVEKVCFHFLLLSESKFVSVVAFAFKATTAK